MAKRKTKKISQESKTRAFLATFLSVVGFLIAIILWRKDKYVMFHAKQSLSVFLISIIFNLVGTVLILLPFFGYFLNFILSIGVMLIWFLSWINALNAEKKRIPLVSDLADYFEF